MLSIYKPKRSSLLLILAEHRDRDSGMKHEKDLKILNVKDSSSGGLPRRAQEVLCLGTLVASVSQWMERRCPCLVWSEGLHDICLLPWIDLKHWEGLGMGLTSWTNVVISCDKNHSLLMTKTYLSRFQTADKAKLPSPAFLKLLLNTWQSFVSPDKEEGKQLRFPWRTVLWPWLTMLTLSRPSQHSESMHAHPLICLCLPRGLFPRRDGTCVLARQTLALRKLIPFIDECTEVLGFVQGYGQWMTVLKASSSRSLWFWNCTISMCCLGVRTGIHK